MTQMYLNVPASPIFTLRLPIKNVREIVQNKKTFLLQVQILQSFHNAFVILLLFGTYHIKDVKDFVF